MQSNNYTYDDPMRQVNVSHMTNQSFTSMLVDAPNSDVTSHHYDVTNQQQNKFNNSGINCSTVALNNHLQSSNYHHNRQAMQNHNLPAVQNPHHFVDYQRTNQVSTSYLTFHGSQSNQSYNSQAANQQFDLPQMYHQQNNGGPYHDRKNPHHQNNAVQGHVLKQVNQYVNRQPETYYPQNKNGQYNYPNVSRHQHGTAANQGPQHVMTTQANQQQSMQHSHSGYHNHDQQYPLVQNHQRNMVTDAAGCENKQILKNSRSSSQTGSHPDVCKSKKERKSRIKFTRHQMEVLKYEFSRSMYLSNDKKKIISTVTGLTEEEVYNWFQNSRAKFNRETRNAKPNQYSRKPKSGQSGNIIEEKQRLVENKLKLRKKRTTLNFDQTDILEDYFKNVTWYPLIDQLAELSRRTKLTKEELTTWFQNRRRKGRKMGFEINKMVDRHVRRRNLCTIVLDT